MIVIEDDKAQRATMALARKCLEQARESEGEAGYEAVRRTATDLLRCCIPTILLDAVLEQIILEAEREPLRRIMRTNPARAPGRAR